MDFIRHYSRFFRDSFLDSEFSESDAKLLGFALNLIALVVIAFILTFLFRKSIEKGFHLFSKHTKTSFDDYLVHSRFPKLIARLIPLFALRYIIPILLQDFDISHLFLEVYDSLLIILSIYVVRSVLRSAVKYLREKDSYRDKPLDSFLQITMIFLWIIGFICIISIVAEVSIYKLLGALTAVSAVILFVFKDVILGFVATIQVTVYDIVRIGDWITIDKFGADGVVTEVNLVTVKVQNFDNTISTVPTYSLVSDSFKNWRGMLVSAGRRIRRKIYIKQQSVRFVTASDLERFSKIQMLANYLQQRQKDIEGFNRKHNFNNSELPLNGRNQTNLGIFRKYCDLYLERHPALNKDLIIMTRHLEPTPHGIPIEIYCFSKDKVWINYERIMADIFEHVLAAVSFFDLEIFENIASDPPQD